MRKRGPCEWVGQMRGEGEREGEGQAESSGGEGGASVGGWGGWLSHECRVRTLYYLPLSEHEVVGSVSISARVELPAVRESPDVVNRDLVAGLRDRLPCRAHNTPYCITVLLY